MIANQAEIVKNYGLFTIFSPKVQSRGKRSVKPAQKASPSKVSRVLGSFRNSFLLRPSSSVICSTSENWQLWSFSWQVMSGHSTLFFWTMLNANTEQPYKIHHLHQVNNNSLISPASREAWWPCYSTGMESSAWPTLFAHSSSHVMARPSLWI